MPRQYPIMTKVYTIRTKTYWSIASKNVDKKKLMVCSEKPKIRSGNNVTDVATTSG